MITAKVVADSASEAGHRLTTLEVEFPRYILSEYNTHRLFSRNAASTRAIPLLKQIEQIAKTPALPIFYGKNKPGMKATEELDSDDKKKAEAIILDMMDYCIGKVGELESLGLHKQHAGRYLEPWAWVKGVVSSTEWDNFFWLRKHPDAQPEIAELARVMWEAREQSEPMLLKAGEWHVPYVEYNSDFGYYLMVNGGHMELTLVDALKVSASCCAQVSYRLADNSLEKAKKIYDMLVESKPVHASPFEHQAQPMSTPYDNPGEGTCMQYGVTHRDMQGDYWSANFKGWVQHRQLIPENACWNYEN